MQATISNSTGDSLIISLRYLTLPNGSSIILRNIASPDQECLSKDFEGSLATLEFELNPSDSFARIVAVDITNDVGGGGTTATTGFKLTDGYGHRVKGTVTLKFGVYDDNSGVASAAHATLNMATKGTINSGGGTNALLVTTDANGEFACTLTDTSDETIYLACSSVPASSSLNCSDVEAISFSA